MCGNYVFVCVWVGVFFACLSMHMCLCAHERDQTPGTGLQHPSFNHCRI